MKLGPKTLPSPCDCSHCGGLYRPGANHRLDRKKPKPPRSPKDSLKVRKEMGKRIGIRRRVYTHMTQEQFCEWSGFPAWKLKDIESGRCWPQLNWLYWLADCLDTKLEYLYGMPELGHIAPSHLDELATQQILDEATQELDPVGWQEVE